MRAAHQGGVLRHRGVRREELLQVGLVPDLPVVDRQRRLAGMLLVVEPGRGPVDATVAVALHRLCEELPPRLALLRPVDRGHVRSASHVAGRAVDDREDRDALAREPADYPVVALPVELTGT